VTLRERWDEQADDWARFARTPGHDRAHEQVNFPAFLELLPPPGRAALDLGCGEGRVGAELTRRGYRVTGVDSSPRMVELAREHHDAVVADAVALPFPDESFELVLAYMSLMNMDDIDGAVRESTRVLEQGGRFCAAVLHPTFAAGSRMDDGTFALGDYFNGPTKVWQSDRDGISMTFYDRVIPLSRYTAAFESAGLLIERVREPASTTDPRLPLYLHLRAVKP
jgi:ubiquinone/menaquinone biosynthesis C-methylase UbiE